MHKIFYILFLFVAVNLTAQTALYNNGNLRIHENGTLGLHTNFINDAPFDANLGLTGFYGNAPLTVSGTLVPLLYDVEIMAENGIELLLGIDTANNTNFIVGDIRTPRNQESIYYNFLNSEGFYSGEGDPSKIDGYAAISNRQDFVFPVGDALFLRPLALNSERVNLFANCAYFFEDPNDPISIDQNFDTNALGRAVETVSNTEFWKLESTVRSTVNISWNSRSNLGALTDDSTNLVLVGWNRTGNRWENLGASAVIGNLEQGFITSEAFLPSDYDILTFGVSQIPFEPLEEEVLTLDNYFVSPNGDGINDRLIIPELAASPNNLLAIYDRYGLKVFEKTNYTDEFSGTSNVNNFVIQRDSGLPAGVYFYTLFMQDLNLNYQGFLYLTSM